MFERQAELRDVAASFLLADQMKKGPFDHVKFLERLATIRSGLDATSCEELTAKVEDSARRKRYLHGDWKLAIVDLDQCHVWPSFGGRAWAKGTVKSVCQDFERRANRQDKVFKIIRSIELPLALLPLIVIRFNDDDRSFRIDDGSHRAVAYYIAGFRQALAYVGSVPAKYNLKH